MPAYALTIFLGAFLLFQVQPLIGKYILPWFGGGPGVWTTCMLFFQVLLVGGYAYAHWLTSRTKARVQVLVHLVILVGAVALLPIIPGESWKPATSENPTGRILLLLLASVGLPYFVLSATGPLVQQWFTKSFPGRSPYRLYALSNAGSLLALVSYPFVFEPHLSRKSQANFWAWGLALYAILCGVCALRRWRVGANEDASPQPEATPDERPGMLRRVLWVALPACASALLLAVTNKLCQDVAVIPFLWIVPLSLYLLSFIICFEHARWYRRTPFALALVAAMVAFCVALSRGSDWSVWQQVGVYSAALFVCCMVCHGELYRLRPAPSHLTSFYLGIAVGGAVGGTFVAVLAPMLFTNYYELHWSMFVCGALFLLVCVTEPWLSNLRQGREAQRGDLPLAAETHSTATAAAAIGLEWRWLACTLPFVAFGGLDWCLSRLGSHWRLLAKASVNGLRAAVWALLAVLVISWIVRHRSRRFAHWRLLACLWLGLGLAALGFTLWTTSHTNDPDRVSASRNFYGVLTVYHHRKDDPLESYYLLQHGRITHGLQFTDPEQSKWPVSYYSPQSGVALALNAELPRARRIGVVGLGTGTLAAFGHPGDYVRFYEINPAVRRIATSPFSYVPNCTGKVEVALGDARLCMEREAPQGFDLLALDAFSSDAIPVHLLTREAFELYQRHVKTNGVIAVHISNHYLDLQPVVENLAEHFHYKMAVIDYDESPEEWWLYSSTWVLLTRDAALLASPEIAAATVESKSSAKKPALWTDDFASLYQILK